MSGASRGPARPFEDDALAGWAGHWSLEGIWSLLKRGVLVNLAVADQRRLVRVVKRGLKKIQYRPHLVDGCLAENGLTLALPIIRAPDITYST